MATTVARLEAILSADTGRFDRSMRQSETRMQKVGGAAKLMGFAIAGVAAVELKRSVEAAMDAERAQVRLETAFKGAHVAIGPYRDSIEKASTAAINLGFDDEALKDSLGSLIIATGDYKRAQDAATVAMDLARFKGTSLEQATKTMTMAMAGSQRAIKQLGITVPPVTAEYDRLKAQFGAHVTASEKARLATAKLEDKQATAAKTIDIVRQKVRGQADAYSKTAAGEMEVFRAKVEELEEALGKDLLPFLTKVTGALITMIDKLEAVDKWLGKVGANKGLIDYFNKLAANTKVQATLEGISTAAKTAYEWFQKLVGTLKWIVDHSSTLGKAFGVVGGVLGKIGDAKDPTFKAPTIGGPKSISPRLYDELAGATAMGLTLTSGYRPGAITKSGHKSDHSYFPSRAIDVAGPPNRMASFFRWLIGQTDVKQAFYDPLGSIFGGALSSYREGGHSDHVHVATYDQGGYLRPGWNLAYNGLGRPEPVGAGNVTINIPNYVGSKTELMSWLQNAATQYRRQNGRSPF